MRRKILNISVKDEGEKENEDEDDEIQDEEVEDEDEDETCDLNNSESELNDDLSQESDEESDEESIEDQLSRVSLSEIDDREATRSKFNYSLILLLVPIFIILLLNCSQLFSHKQDDVDQISELQLNFERVNELNQKYPKLLSSKKMRIIKTRLAVMRKEVSILMLLGKSKDVKCKSDPTYCIGQTIANVTQVQYGYIDASNPRIKSDEIEQELTHSLDGNKHAVMIDSLEKLPSSQVMNLFQFIDKDETHTRRGMLLFLVYTGFDGNDNSKLSKMRDAEIAEKILLDRWSPSIPIDSLTSVISRICGSIVRVY